MRSFIVCLMFLSSSISLAANTFFLSKFIGAHEVVKRNCKTEDAICAHTGRVELLQVDADTFSLKEYDSSSKLISSKELKQNFGDLISTTIGGFDSANGGGFTGMWNLLEKNPTGAQIRTEAVYFNSDSLFIEDTIKLSIQLWKKSEKPNMPNIKYRRDYILTR